MSVAKSFLRFTGLNRYTVWEGKVPTTLFSDRPIVPTAEYCRLVDRERALILFLLAIIVLVGPLIFRYLMGSHASITDDDGTSSGWGAEMDPWEWSIGMVLFFGFIGTVLRLLPFICGRPSSFESSRSCVLDGTVGLGICSPFASEDDTVMLRSLLGRTCTVFSTVGSRHSLHGLYLDAIMNERRIKGEAQRKAIWVAWMKFLTSLVEVSLKMREEERGRKNDDEVESELTPNIDAVQVPLKPNFPSSSGKRIDRFKPGKFASTLPTIKSRGDVLGQNYNEDDDYDDDNNNDEGNDEFNDDNDDDNKAEVIDTTTLQIDDFGNADDPQILLTSIGRSNSANSNNNSRTTGIRSRSARSFSLASSTYIGSKKIYSIASQQQPSTQDRLKVLHLGNDLRVISHTTGQLDDDNGKFNAQSSGRHIAIKFGDAIGKLSASFDYFDDTKEDMDKNRSQQPQQPPQQQQQHRTVAASPLASAVRAFTASRDEAYHGTPLVRYIDHLKAKGHTQTALVANSKSKSNDKSISRDKGGDSTSPSPNSPIDDVLNPAADTSDTETAVTDAAIYQRGGSGVTCLSDKLRPPALQIANDSAVEAVTSLTSGSKRMSFYLHDPQQIDTTTTAADSAAENVVFTPSAASLRKLTFDPTIVEDSRTPRGRVPASHSSTSASATGTPISTTRTTAGEASKKSSDRPRQRNFSCISDDSGYVHNSGDMEFFAIGNHTSSQENASAPPVQYATASSDDYMDHEKEVIQRWDNAYASSNNLPSLKVDMADIVPMIEFLDGWLQEMKKNEWTWNYHDPKGALEKFFFACPYVKYFQSQHLLDVQSALKGLYEVFSGSVKDEPDPKQPVHRDDISEVEWIIQRRGMPDWTVVWSLASRARLRELDRASINDPYGPDAVYNNVRIKPGAIVYQKLPLNILPEYTAMMFFETRANPFKVDHIETQKDGRKMAYVFPFPNPGRVDIETGRDLGAEPLVLPLDQLVLLEKNRGKTGALNFFNDYLRARTVQWAATEKMLHPVQTLTGIVDARHALVETDMFWNDALPYFSLVGATGEPGKRFGGLTKHSLCCMIQYPQFFSNVTSLNDELDNTNGSYYNLWQPLRDGAKAIGSSGTNAIWDISHPDFEFCTTSRSEDLGSSHKCIPHSAAVYLSVNVCYAVAKQTEDFLEALYRWSAGPLELLWPAFFDWSILKHFIITGIPVLITSFASWARPAYWYYLYLAMVGAFCIQIIIDKVAGRKPLRSFVVSTIISVNLFIVLSNILSVTWYVIFPVRIAFYGTLPMTRNDVRAIFWGWISIFFALTQGIIYDSLIRITKHTAYGNKTYDYDQSLWRGGQLYSCSFMFTLLATIAGSFSAFKAWWYDLDLSMWSSFRIGANQLTKLWENLRKQKLFSSAWFNALWAYIALYAQSCLAQLTMPTVMTRWYVSCTFILQFVCIVVSTLITNQKEPLNLVVLLFVCGLNIAMLVEVAVLLQPAFKRPLGYPLRAEYMFSYLGILIIIASIYNGALDIRAIQDRVRLY